ncbi:MAG: helix-turn-helix domain-containing protein [Candidatus Sumerlaeia bacterium]|nr:helix-turn-helix domain-containing protein [Candidatus Sumerlaeia bacterium]
MSRKSPPVTPEQIETLSPLAREIAEGLQNAIAYTRGESGRGRVTRLELPDPAPEYGESDIRAERLRLRLTQEAFARILNISPKTVEAWEAGRKAPGPPARRLLQVLTDEATLRVIARYAGYQLVPTAGGDATETSAPTRRGVRRARG